MTKRTKRAYRFWTKDEIALLKQHSRNRTPVRKLTAAAAPPVAGDDPDEGLRAPPAARAP